MQTAVIENNCRGMVCLKFFGYLTQPKIIAGFFILDLAGFFDLIAKYFYHAPNFFSILVTLCCIDLVTGVLKVVVKEGVKAVTSRGLRDTVTKTITYGAFIYLFYMVSKIDAASAWIYPLAYKFLIMIEVKSVYENIVTINPNLDFIDNILQKIMNTFKKKEDDK